MDQPNELRIQQLIDGMLREAQELEKDGLLSDALLHQINQRIANLTIGTKLRNIVLERQKNPNNLLLAATDLSPDVDSRLMPLERAIYNYLLRTAEKGIGTFSLMKKIDILAPELHLGELENGESMVEKAVAKLYRITQYNLKRVVFINVAAGIHFFKITSKKD